MAEKDLTEKTLEAFNDVFADIINGLLFNGEQVLRQESLIDAQTFSMYKADGNLHHQDRDVAKYWIDQHGERITVRMAFLGIENQSNYDPDMPLRVIGYDGAVYRAELSQKDRYPVVTLVLYFGDRPWGMNRTIYDVVHIPEKLRPFVNDYRSNLFEIANLPETAVEHLHSDFRAVVDYFISSRSEHVYELRNSTDFTHVDELLTLMSVLTQDNRFAESLEWEGGKPQNMSSLLDRVEERGRQKGLDEGHREGRQEGRREGRQEGFIEGADQNCLKNIRSLMESMKLTAKQAMDALKIPESEQPKYIARL